MLRRYTKGIAIILLVTFGQEIVLPGTVWALTGGPGQPEVSSFQSVGTSQMVNLTTGDFNYNIPLMTVPGPNGGYPINLSYDAGIGMEQEASWVGLGWNINPGAVTRNLRGVPDDFNGDEVEQKLNLKDNITTGLNVGLKQLVGGRKELFGLDNFDWSLNAYFNNYRGAGFTFTPSPVKLLNKTVSIKNTDLFMSGLNLSFDSQTGLNLGVGLGLSSDIKLFNKMYKGFGTNAIVGWNNGQGLNSIRFDSHRISERQFDSKRPVSTFINFASSAYFPNHGFSMIGTNTSRAYTITPKNSLSKLKKKLTIEGQYIKNTVKDSVKTLKSYGTLYLDESEVSEFSDEDADYLQDINLAHDVPVTKRSKNMAVPIATADIYTITGQGVGGVFRAHRNDVGRYHSSQTTSANVTSGFGVELASGVDSLTPSTTVIHLGGDAPINVGGAWSYSGKPLNGNEHIANLDFQEKDTRNPRYEPVYFKMSGEHTAVPANQWDHINGLDTTALELGMQWYEDDIAQTPMFKNRVRGVGGSSGQLTSPEGDRIKRTQSIQFKTKSGIAADAYYTDRADHIYTGSEIPGIDEGNQIDYSTLGNLEASEGESHIHEYEIVRPDGSRYIYGLPTYNIIQQENIFSNNNGVPTMYEDGDLVSYDPADASIENDEGLEHYYSSNEIPAYVNAHLITQINSADYVDLTGNGASEDDLGFYAKFNYTAATDYKWREPFYDADYIKGFYSNTADDKASFVYGEKELHYLQSVETKTHVAVFELGTRADGRGVSEIHQTSASELGATQKYLKRIKLYSKADLNRAIEDGIPISDVDPLQTVHFKYSYELCQNVYNNNNIGDAPDDPEHFTTALNDGGKLTLKEVFITYNGNEKGRLSPYRFNYTSNQNYNRLNMDRWGNYQESESINEHEINPYTRQNLSEAERIENASAWCLNEINLPSGGTIRVDYEQDDYGYVQDKRAGQMVKILGFSDTSTVDFSSLDATGVKRLSKKQLRLWFRADGLEDVSGDSRNDIIFDYVQGLDLIYFKTFVELKEPHEAALYAKDYVVGYAEVDVQKPNYYGADPDENYGYVDLKAEDYKSMGLDLFKTHPIRKAAWQYLRYSRQDLFNALDDLESTDAVDEFWESIGLLTNTLNESLLFMALGEYNRYKILNYCGKMNTDKDSFVRLNSPNKKKYGGGHRVKGVYLSDNWTEGARNFGTEYSYVNEDGSTSGVADYEPIVGGEENSLKQPKFYNPNGDLINFQHQDLYLEEPLMEALYPAPKVVYGRVVQRSTGHLPEDPPAGFSVEDSQVGVTVHEFYTSKDFPVIEEHTTLNHEGYNAPIPVPLVGFMSYNNNGFSQGYKIELNDMSGKQKSVAVYPFSADFVNDEPISKTEFIYREDELTSKRDRRRLNNLVNVLDAHGQVRRSLMGVETDFTIYEEENSSYAENMMLQGNIDISINASGLTLPVPTAWPNINFSQFVYRGLSTSKVIYRSGILEKVIVTTDGSSVTTENLMYDAQTGEALLTSVDNEWDQPVYNYNYAGHWNYETMGGAFENYGAKVYYEGASGVFSLYSESGGTLISPSVVLQLGDEIAVNEGGVINTYYVSDISGDNFELQTHNGLSAPSTSGSEGIITRSGNRNQQMIKSGTILALSTDFLYASGDFSGPFAAWNTYVTGADPQEGADYILPGVADYLNLNTGELALYDWYADRIFVPNAYNCQTGNHHNLYLMMTVSEYDDKKIDMETDDPYLYSGDLTFDPTDNPMDDGLIFPVTLDGGVVSYTEQLVEFEVIDETFDVFGSTSTVTLRHLPTDSTYTANYTANPNPWVKCEVSDILHADAVIFADDWDYPYSDVGDPLTADGALISDLDINEYRYGKKGIWRAKQTFLYQIPRKQSGAAPSGTRINIDGEYEPWEPYSWLDGHLNPKWDWVSEITKYSPYGFAIEERSRLSNGDDNPATELDERTIYSSQLYGYENSVVIATSALASYFEVGYTGFEQGSATADTNNTGHINLVASGVYNVVDTVSHTGQNSLMVNPTESMNLTAKLLTTEPNQLSALQGKEYVVSLWVNVEEADAYGTLSAGGKTVSTEDSREVIDGWKKLEVAFTMGATDELITYTSSGTTFIDDIRFGPYEGGMMTYVYDPDNLWLLAELDGLNYATFYNYDTEGNLIQVKKETEEGVVTVKTARTNTTQLP